MQRAPHARQTGPELFQAAGLSADDVFQNVPVITSNRIHRDLAPPTLPAQAEILKKFQDFIPVATGRPEFLHLDLNRAFDAGSPLLPLSLLIAFINYICMSSRGSIADRITVVTLQNKIGLFLGLTTRLTGSSYSSEITQQLYAPPKSRRTLSSEATNYSIPPPHTHVHLVVPLRLKRVHKTYHPDFSLFHAHPYLSDAETKQQSLEALSNEMQLGFMPGPTTHNLQTANLGDGRGDVNEIEVLRQSFGIPGVGFDGWKPFPSISPSWDRTSFPCGYDIGRDLLVASAVGKKTGFDVETFKLTTYNTVLTNLTGLIAPSSGQSR
ncbi:hypothetical protein C8R45DRAFT_1071536 [Mycena sanguinolenta]|nr:hypothetical protein C8R45DRAFT_1071536 [Mycena sanguinolenta]